jgi:hypothetical protein
MEVLVKMNAFLFAAFVVAAASSFGCVTTSIEPRVAKPVAIEGDHPLTVRTDAGTLWIGSHVWSEVHRVWKAPATGPIEDLSIRTTAYGHEITFLEGGLQWRGEVDRDQNARGPLEVLRECNSSDKCAEARSTASARTPTTRTSVQ